MVTSMASRKLLKIGSLYNYVCSTSQVTNIISTNYHFIVLRHRQLVWLLLAVLATLSTGFAWLVKIDYTRPRLYLQPTPPNTIAQYLNNLMKCSVVISGELKVALQTRAQRPCFPVPMHMFRKLTGLDRELLSTDYYTFIKSPCLGW